jgi:hypothetical protein
LEQGHVDRRKSLPKVHLIYTALNPLWDAKPECILFSNKEATSLNFNENADSNTLKDFISHNHHLQGESGLPSYNHIYSLFLSELN